MNGFTTHSVRQNVLTGLARFVDPQDLERLGYEVYLQEIPEAVRGNYQDIREGNVLVVTEPHMGFWYVMDAALNNEVLSLILSRSGEDFDYLSARREVERKANSGMMFRMSERGSLALEFGSFFAKRQLQTNSLRCWACMYAPSQPGDG